MKTFKNFEELSSFLDSIAEEIGADCEVCYFKGNEHNDVVPYGITTDGVGLFVLATCKKCGTNVEVGDGDYFTHREN